MTYISAFILGSALFAIIVIWSLVEFLFQRKKDKYLES